MKLGNLQIGKNLYHFSLFDEDLVVISNVDTYREFDVPLDKITSYIFRNSFKNQVLIPEDYNRFEELFINDFEELGKTDNLFKRHITEFILRNQPLDNLSARYFIDMYTRPETNVDKKATI